MATTLRRHCGAWYSYIICVVMIVVTDYVSHGSPTEASPARTDPHGGVPMGKSNIACDNAKNFTAIDWSPDDVEAYTCRDGTRYATDDHKYFFHCDEKAKRPIHVCYPAAIHYDEDIPTSGPHRPLWPRYGEYTYLPAQRWLHSLEHGSIVFLYHPCTDSRLVQAFKTIAKGCIRRHIISPYQKLPDGMNFAVLAWRCKLLLSHPHLSDIVRFVRTHALHSPEASVHFNGQYDLALIHNAEMVSDKFESDLCPNMDVISETIESLNEESIRRRNEYMVTRHRLQDTFRRLSILASKRIEKRVHN